MRKVIGSLIALGLIAFGIVAFIGQSNMARQSGNSDDFYAGIVIGGGLGFAGLVLLYALFRKRKTPSGSDGANGGIWGVGMASALDDDDDYGDD